MSYGYDLGRSSSPEYYKPQQIGYEKKAASIYHDLKNNDRYTLDEIISVGSRLVQLAKEEKKYLSGVYLSSVNKNLSSEGSVKELAGSFNTLGLGGGKVEKPDYTSLLNYLAKNKGITRKELLNSHGNKKMGTFLNEDYDLLKAADNLSYDTTRHIGLRLGITIIKIERIEIDKHGDTSGKKLAILHSLKQAGALDKITLNEFIDPKY